MKKTLLTIVIAIAALGAPACGKKEEPKPTVASGSAPTAGSDTAGSAAMAGSGSAGSAAMAGSGSAGSAAAPVAEVDVPTEVDFEGEAATKIDEKNVEAKLKAVEQELSQ